MNESTAKIMFVFLVGFSLLCFLMALIGFLLYKKQMHECTEQTTGINNNTKFSRNKFFTYTINGVNYEYRYLVRSSFPRKNSPTEQVVICYNPNNPKKAYIQGKSFLSFWGISFLGLIAAGLICLCVAFILFH